MLYPEYESRTKKKISVKRMDGGVNLRELPFNIDDGQCSELKNMWFERGALSTRPGLEINPENKLYDRDTYHMLWYDVSLFPAEVSPLSEPCRLVLCRESNMEGVRLKFSFIYADSSIQSAGSIDFYRASPTASFYTPHLCCVFYNNSQRGSGIYVMLCLYDYMTGKGDGRIRFYELDNDLVTWTNVTEEKMYVPTVYINGRGNNYGAVWEEPVPSFAPTAFCEPMNMLTGKFRAFYGTDGLSHSFKLPFENLTNRSGEHITCTLNILGSLYSWSIAPDSDISNTLYLMGKNMAVRVDRAEGRIMFIDPANGNSVAPAITSIIGNNLEIVAYKSDFAAVNSLNTAQIFCEYSSRLFISGFEGDENAVYFSAQSNPFYFPSQNIVRAGSQSGKITALAKQGKLLIAFKENECYSIDSKNVQEYKMDAVISGIEDLPKKFSDIRLDLLSSEIGCDCPATLLNCANRLVWLNSSGVIYTIIASNQYSKGNVYELSLNIEPYLKGLDKETMRAAFAVCHGGYYIAFIGKNAVAMDYTIKGFRYVASYSDQKQASRSIYWYLWQLPEELTLFEGATVNGEAVLIGCRATDENFWYGTVTLSGEEDCIPMGHFDTLYIEKRSISYSLKSKNFDFATARGKKFINGAYLYMGNKQPVTLSIIDGDNVLAEKTVPEGSGAAPRRVHLKNVPLSLCAIGLKGEGQIQLGGFELNADVTEE